MFAELCFFEYGRKRKGKCSVGQSIEMYTSQHLNKVLSNDSNKLITLTVSVVHVVGALDKLEPNVEALSIRERL